MVNLMKIWLEIKKNFEITSQRIRQDYATDVISQLYLLSNFSFYFILMLFNLQTIPTCRSHLIYRQNHG